MSIGRIVSVAEAKAALRATAATADDTTFRPLAVRVSVAALGLGIGASLLSGGGLKGLGRAADAMLRLAPALMRLL